MSSACCQLPPVQADYTPKGDYIELAGFKAYAIGPEDATAVLLYVYDIFGFSPQILQGADLLATQGFRVVMPDLLLGNYATAAMFQPGFGAEEDADKINVPLCLLTTQAEDMNIYNKIYAKVEAKVPGKNFIKQFETMPHGFMAARGVVSGGEATDKYHEGYTILSSFFKEHLAA